MMFRYFVFLLSVQVSCGGGIPPKLTDFMKVLLRPRDQATAATGNNFLSVLPASNLVPVGALPQNPIFDATAGSLVPNVLPNLYQALPPNVTTFSEHSPLRPFVSHSMIPDQSTFFSGSNNNLSGSEDDLPLNFGSGSLLDLFDSGRLVKEFFDSLGLEEECGSVLGIMEQAPVTLKKMMAAAAALQKLTHLSAKMSPHALAQCMFSPNLVMGLLSNFMPVMGSLGIDE